MKPLSIEGAWLRTPEIHRDHRGSFTENFRREECDLAVAQVNWSVSKKNTIRGIHFSDQAKYVSCVRGAIMDVIVDVRAGSPSFGKWEAVHLDEENQHSVLISAGLGHAFLALADCTVFYLCSAVHDPAREHGINPMDPELGIGWEPDGKPILSGKDFSAPSLADYRKAMCA